MYLISLEDFKSICEEFGDSIPNNIQTLLERIYKEEAASVQLLCLLDIFFKLTNIDHSSDIGIYTIITSNNLDTMLKDIQDFDVAFDVADINSNIGVGDSDVIYGHNNRSISKRVLPFTKEKPIIGPHLRWGIQTLLEEFPGLKNIKNFTYKVGIVSSNCSLKLSTRIHEYAFGNRLYRFSAGMFGVINKSEEMIKEEKLCNMRRKLFEACGVDKQIYKSDDVLEQERRLWNTKSVVDKGLGEPRQIKHLHFSS